MERYVEVNSPVAGKSKAGAITRTWTVAGYLYMSRVQEGTGQERTINGRTVVPRQYTYTCHAEMEIDETMRLVDEGKSYNILFTSELERGLFIEMLVEEVLE